MRVKLKHALIDHLDGTGEKQWQVAIKIKKSENWLSLVVMGTKDPLADEADEIASILGKPVKELFPDMDFQQVA